MIMNNETDITIIDNQDEHILQFFYFSYVF